MRVLLAAGGSGGHIFPMVSLASELEKNGVEDIYFIASRRRLDRNILAPSRHPCYFLSANPMPFGFKPVRSAVFAWKMAMDTASSAFLLGRLRPDVVVGFGGYSSGAAAAVAGLMRIPVVIHEQNLVPGRANKILGRIADRVAVSFPETSRYFGSASDKVFYSGNPLRSDILGKDRREGAERLGLDPAVMTVLVMGGSQGSSFLNSTASRAALLVKREEGNAVQFIHLTGRKDHGDVTRFYEENGLRGRVFSFLEGIDDAYAASDLAVSRAGAAAVFELASYSRPMILVPYPNPANNQRHNAEYFAEAGAAVLKEERDLTPEDLAAEILGVIRDGQRRQRMARAAGNLSVPEAGEKLAGEVMRIAARKRA